jgi:hypothetical protein
VPSILLFFLITASVAAMPGAARAQSTADEKAVIALADSALAAISRGDAAAFTELMIPEAMLYSTCTRGGVTICWARIRQAQREADRSGVVERGYTRGLLVWAAVP